jgi:two-component system phosphate regulon sensor histidine kinase PhoR
MTPEIAEDRSALFDLVVSSLPVGLIALDRDRRIVEFNPAAEKITGYSRAEVEGKLCWDVLTSNMCKTVCLLRKDTGRGAQVLEERSTIITKDQREIPVLYTSALLKDDHDEFRGEIIIFRDISESEQLEKHRKVLISMFAHDLKAPVAIAGGFLMRLLEGKGGGEITAKQRTYLEAVDNEIKRLDAHIHSFLNILRMEAGQIALSLEPCSVDSVLHDLLEGFKMEAAQRRIMLRIELPDSLALVLADKGQLQRVTSNLIDNAIKYSPEDSEVVVRVYETSNHVACQIKDSGPGISSNDLPHIFDPFFRGGRAKARGKEPGSGLGLAIVRSIVEAHGGKVWVKSEVEKGSIFTFTIPKRLTE